MGNQNSGKRPINAKTIMQEKNEQEKAKKYNTYTEGAPSNISSDVYITMSEELKLKAIQMVTEKKYDIIQIEHSQLSWIVPFLKIASPSSKFVLDLHNAEYRIYESWLPYCSEEDHDYIENKYNTLKNWEEKVWKWYDAAFTVSPIEEQIIKIINPSAKTFLVPTGGGIDPDKYSAKETVEKKYDLLYLGTMNWFPNAHGLIWFLDNAYPKILEKRPNTKLYIAGYGDPNSTLCKRAMADPNIEFLGQIENDVYYFQTSKVFIVPLWIGAGARVKIPTAWASRLPVVSTTFGAEGSDAIHNENIMLADDPDKFADCVLELLDSQELQERIADNAYKTLCEKYSLQYCVELLVNAYHELARNE